MAPLGDIERGWKLSTSFRVDADTWRRFRPVAEAHGLTLSAMVDQLVQRAVEAHEQEAA